MPTSAELIRRVAAGDQDAWGLLAERHLETLRATAAAICGDSDLAEDAVQDAFLRLRNGAGTFAPRGGDGEDEGRRWIRRLAANCAIDRLRQQRRARQQALAGEGPPAPPPGEGPDEGAQAALGRAMAGLGTAARTALELRYHDGLEGAALAAALGVSRVAARVRLHRALGALRRHLAAEGVVATPLLLALLPPRDGAAGEAVPAEAFAVREPGLLAAGAAAGGAVAAAIVLGVGLSLGGDAPPPAAAPAPAATAQAAGAVAAWTPLFPGDSLAGWRFTRGTWSWRAGVVRGEASAADYARIEGVQAEADLELRCRVRVGGQARYGELQVGGYNWYFALNAGAAANDAGWCDLHLVLRGGDAACSVDGVPLAPQPGDGAPPRPGPLAFYAARNGSIEIADARLRRGPPPADGWGGF